MRLCAVTVAGAAMLLGACTLPEQPARLLDRLPPGALVLLGEQHDADDHQRLAQSLVARLAQKGALAGVVLEMVDRGRDTRGLPAGSNEDTVRERLAWNDRGWPWDRYGPVVMTAVHSGIPVAGGNLPRAAMGAAMRDASLDALLEGAAREQLAVEIREGHCGLMPESRIPAMTRIQIARDRSMAETLASLAEPSRHVLLLAGGQHVRRSLGVPRQLPAALSDQARVIYMQAGQTGPSPSDVDHVWQSAALPARDHCAELRQQMGR